MTVRKITDFTVGDRIVAATYEISYFNEDDVEDALSDMFEDIYLAEEATSVRCGSGSKTSTTTSER